MEGFGFEKILLILLVVLLLFGARRIPELAASMGKGIREFKKNLSSDPDQQQRDGQTLRADPPPPRVGAPAQPSSAVREETKADPKRLIG